MDRYDEALGECLAGLGFRPAILSNFRAVHADLSSQVLFRNRNGSPIARYVATLAGMASALAWCKRHRVRMAILHLFKGSLAEYLCIRCSAWLGIRLVVIVHEVSPTGEKGPLPFRVAALRSRVHALVVHNRQTLDELVAVRGSEKDIRVVPHIGYPASATSKAIALPHSLVPESALPTLLFFGQVKRSKGLDILLKAMAHLVSPCRLVVAGRFRDVNAAGFRHLVHSTGTADRVIVLDRFIADRERDALMGMAQAVVLPYTRGYQSGVMIAAMSHGKVVIASDLDSHREVISHGDNGLLFRSGDSNALAGLLNAYLEGTYDAGRIGHMAQRTMAEQNGCKVVGRLFSSVLAP